MSTEDLSGPEPVDPLEALALDAVISDAQRGYDILHLTPVAWAVCKLCDRPVTRVPGRSRCCRAPLRIQGWAPPR